MTEYEHLTVPERGSREIREDLWRKLSNEDGFWNLVDRRRVKVVQGSRGKVRLEGLSYVGRAMFGDVLLEVAEKIDGALASLLTFASHGAFRVDPAAAPSTELDKLAALLVGQFLSSVRGYVSEGRDFRYGTESGVGSLVRGRLDVVKTSALRSRGLKHLVAYNRNVIVRRTPKNRVLLAALRETETLSPIINLDPDDLATARGLSMLFDDCRDPEVLFGKRDNMARLAQSLAEDRNEPSGDRDMLTLASVLLAHVSFEHERPFLGKVPRAWFLSLESLFQTAVKQVLEDSLKPVAEVLEGSEMNRLMFDKGPRKVNPDLVLRDAGSVVAVGDVKYKDWDKTIKRPDLYQLLVHAAAFDSRNCFLIFPHDGFEVRDFGTSCTGSRTWAFAVDVRAMDDGLRAASRVMGLLA